MKQMVGILLPLLGALIIPPFDTMIPLKTIPGFSLQGLDPRKTREGSLQGAQGQGSNPDLGPGFQGEKIDNPDTLAQFTALPVARTPHALPKALKGTSPTCVCRAKHGL
ncbi:hypothetical protein DSO57_1030254 [Entomophthora muscae]|uniref:Uncharacterized protein n=1 Tax=Entomophthora muscae TaxID=34485 RepID=A0ACC2ULS7_9FUNG|nr:hypothetical protein DSO57_1030254 [Entomophthora muscae]